MPPTFLPRLVTTTLRDSSIISSQDKFLALEKEKKALEHLLNGGDSTTAPEDIREAVLIYEGGDEDWLHSMLSALLEEKEALIFRHAAVGSKGISTVSFPAIIISLP